MACSREITSEIWLGLYLQGKKIGYQHIMVNRHDGGYLLREDDLWRVAMYGSEKRLMSNSIEKTDADLNLKEFEFKLRTQDQAVEARGWVWQDTLFVELSDGNGRRRISYPLGGKPLLTSLIAHAMFLTGKVKTGEFIVFDPSTFSLKEGKVEALGTERIEHRGRSLKCETYMLEVAASRSKIWVHDCKIIREEAPMGIVAVEEPESLAVKGFEKLVDLLSFYSIKVDTPLSEDVHYIKLELQNIPTSNLDLEFGPQRVVEQGDTWAIVEYSAQGFAEPLSNPNEFLKSTPFVQVDAPEIQEVASKIVQGLDDDSAKAFAILSWVFNELEKRPSVTLPSAVDVLKERYGDCNEHAVLFAALARASGIPTEILVGLVYQNGAYYYHAWNAVYVHGKWFFVDPIFFEFPAKATHLLLKRGGIDRQADIVPVVGRLKIKVLEAK